MDYQTENTCLHQQLFEVSTPATREMWKLGGNEDGTFTVHILRQQRISPAQEPYSFRGIDQSFHLVVETVRKNEQRGVGGVRLKPGNRTNEIINFDVSKKTNLIPKRKD